MNRITHVVQEEAAHPTHQRPIDSRSSTAQESPGVFPEVGHGGIGVVQKGEHDDPVVGEEVRDEVVLGEGGDRGVVGPNGKESHPGGETDVSNDDWNTVRLAEESGRREPVLIKSSMFKSGLRPSVTFRQCQDSR